VYDAWNRLRTRLTRERGGGRYVNEYAAVVEVQTRGALHLHVLMTGRYVPQRKLVGMAMDAGFGRCTDIREVKRSAAGDAPGSSAYVTKPGSTDRLGICAAVGVFGRSLGVRACRDFVAAGLSRRSCRRAPFVTVCGQRHLTARAVWVCSPSGVWVRVRFGVEARGWW
jgi:hypothetical protein